MTDAHQLYAHLFLGEEAELVMRSLLVGTETLPLPLARRLGVPVDSVREALKLLWIHKLVIGRSLTTRARDDMAFRVDLEFPARLRKIIDRVRELDEKTQDRPVETWQCACPMRPPMDYHTVLRECRSTRRGGGGVFYCRFCETEPVAKVTRPLAVETRRHDNQLINALSATL